MHRIVYAVLLQYIDWTILRVLAVQVLASLTAVKSEHSSFSCYFPTLITAAWYEIRNSWLSGEFVPVIKWKKVYQKYWVFFVQTRRSVKMEKNKIVKSGIPYVFLFYFCFFHWKTTKKASYQETWINDELVKHVSVDVRVVHKWRRKIQIEERKILCCTAVFTTFLLVSLLDDVLFFTED